MQTFVLGSVDAVVQERSFVLNGWPIMIIESDGQLYAAANVCPHNGAALSNGLVKGTSVTCPWHLWRFDVTTGQMFGSDSCSIATYEVRVSASGQVEIDVPEPARTLTLRESLLEAARSGPVR